MGALKLHASHAHPPTHNTLGYTRDTRGDARGDTRGNTQGDAIRDSREWFFCSSFPDNVTHARGNSELESNSEPVLVVNHHFARREPVRAGPGLPALFLELPRDPGHEKVCVRRELARG